jgi:hypothetical protein
MTSQELTQELTQLFALGYGFLLLCGAIYAIVWAFALLALILNGSRLAKAGARWLDADHVPNSLIEIGITRYENEGKPELPHRHKRAFEFQYMTAGLTAYLDLTTTEEHIFRKGDFYVIEPGAVYAQKSVPGTEILFIKVPPGNDKVPVDITPEVEA